MSALTCGITLIALPPAAGAVATVFAKHEATHGDRWRQQPVAAYVRHAADHLTTWQAGDRGGDHLRHAACRVLFALVLVAEEEQT